MSLAQTAFNRQDEVLREHQDVLHTHDEVVHRDVPIRSDNDCLLPSDFHDSNSLYYRANMHT